MRELPVVIKFGGHAMTVPKLSEAFASDLTSLSSSGGWRFVVVHGGGPQISSLLKRLGIESRFKDGLRVTDDATMEAVEMVLCGQVNKAVVGMLSQLGVRCAGVSGRDAGLLTARAFSPELGHVGAVNSVDASLLRCLVDAGIMPVVAPVAESEDGGPINVNADTAAGAVAGALKAEYFVLMSDVPGVLDADGKLLPSLTRARIAELKASGVISGGMIPKVDACLNALDAGCARALILNGSEPSALRRYLLEGAPLGTVVLP